MPGIESILGESVVNNSGNVISASYFAKQEKTVCLYFSSSLCSERIFTPFLVNFFSRFRERCGDERLEIVYVSADKDESSFMSYFSEMPWYAVSFSDYQRRSMLWKKYRVQSTPTLVLIDGPTGRFITNKGRDCLSDDLNGVNFPWEPKSLACILQGKVFKQSEVLEDIISVTNGKMKGFYFAAHWCPPCRTFALQLATVYEKISSTGHKFEVVFVSSDRSETSFREYYQSMPPTWLAIPYNDERIQHLTRHFAVQGIPTLVMVDEFDKVICSNARHLIADDLDGSEFPWRRKYVEELSEPHWLLMYENAALVYFTDGNSEHIENAKKLLNEVASSYADDSSQSTPDESPLLNFYYEGAESDEVADTIRSFAQLEGRNATVAILDPFDQRVYSTSNSSGTITRADIDKLIAEFKQSAVLFDHLHSS